VGNTLYGPVATNTLWSGFGGPCQATNDGDAKVRYDRIADRWVLTQFSVNGGNGPFYQCIAVSTSPDPAGTYHPHTSPYSGFNDWPQLSLWPDAYYMTYNMFPNNTFAGAKVCALDRAKMLAGQAASQICVDTSSNFYGGLQVADLDGPTQPPQGSSAYVVSL